MSFIGVGAKKYSTTPTERLRSRAWGATQGHLRVMFWEYPSNATEELWLLSIIRRNAWWRGAQVAGEWQSHLLPGKRVRMRKPSLLKRWTVTRVKHRAQLCQPSYGATAV